MSTTLPATSEQVLAGRKMPALPAPLIIASVIAVIGIASFAVFARWGGLSFSIKPTQVMDVLAPLILTAGFIERAVEVLVSPWRDTGAKKLRQAVKAAQAAVPPAQDRIDQAIGALDQYKGKTQQYAFVASLTLGLAAGIVGLRALWPLLDVSKFGSASAVQRVCFDVIDVVLSAGLLAGGADGIHSVVSAFTGFFDASAKKMQQ